MMVRAEVVLICTDKGISSGLVSPAVYPFVFMIIILTSVLAPLLLKLSYKNELPLAARAARRNPPISLSPPPISRRWKTTKKTATHNAPPPAILRF